MNKNKVLVPALGIAGLTTAIIPFALTSCNKGGGGEDVHSRITDEDSDPLRLDFVYDGINLGPHTIGSFKWVDPDETYSESDLSITLEAIGAEGIFETQGGNAPGFHGAGSLVEGKDLVFYLINGCEQKMEPNVKYPLAIKIVSKEGEVFYNNTGTGAGGNKKFTISWNGN